jgi:uncharacterized membrane protein
VVPSILNNKNISQDLRSYRLSSIDMLRGLVVVLMAIDHVRMFFMEASVRDLMNQPDIPVLIYLTRWITHFCAPAFIFLAGTSAGLMATRKTPLQMGAFLCKRGLWLIFVEIFVISTANTFSPLGMAEYGGATRVVLQVIWAIGASMILLAVFQFLGARVCLFLGGLILLGHNLFDPLWPSPDLSSGDSSLWSFLFYQGSFILKHFFILQLYPLLAWFGVMLMGFGSACIFQQEASKRNRMLISVGSIFIITFLLIRASGLYGDSNPWRIQEQGILTTILDFMNVTKYPPSLLFLLITLGPLAILAGCADRFRGRCKNVLVMFGRVPFLFYVTHFYLIHILAACLGVMQGFKVNQFLTSFRFFPEGYGVGLGGVFLGWLMVLILLYPLCKWFAAIKARRRDWWLSYL